ncbi:MAG: cytochrome o ubiquinol oxidase subunit I [Gammaproteobacteria bacterium]|nr:cytochrome o ubiquinol oxidase subunit I [Gammaproteobacteria bacterium]
MNILGRLTIDAIPLHDPIIMTATGFMIVVFIGVCLAITVAKKWKVVLFDWVASVDHKKIGIMYLLLSFVMLLRGFSDAVLMRTQQVLSVGSATGFLPPEHFAEIFTAHGVIMIFFVAMPFMFGLMNIIIPLQIGARDVAFPYLNNFSFWMTFVGAMLVNLSLAIGRFASAGWLAYPPLSELQYSPGVGIDYYLWGLQIAGIGTLLGGINFIVTILKMRAKGMTLMKMPIFVWTALCSMILVAAVFPILTATFVLLALDRMLDMHFFTEYAGGNMMMYINLIWAWGHPEVYILVLPAFGIFSEVVATFSQKKLFGYNTMVYAVAVITVLSFCVWLHHFFTMGAGGNVNAVFGIATMVISIPTGVKVFNWLFTMYKGKIIYKTPMLWVTAFFTTFAFGGMTGVMLAIPPVDFQFHNSLFLVAHFHNVIIGGVLFGYFAGFIYWFPKMFGFKLHEKLGIYAFICWLIGYYVTFTPIYMLGLLGYMRRTDHFDNVGVQPYFILAAIGTAIIFIGVLFQIAQLIYSIINREKLRDRTGDPWNGRTLEWSVSSPAPIYNFAIEPKVNRIDQFWYDKQHNKENRPMHPQEKQYQDIHMPKNTLAGFVTAIIVGILGFALIWHMWLIAAVSLTLVIIAVIVKSFNLDVDYYIKAQEVKKTEVAHFKEVLAHE